jgi:hypothetical protein
LTAHVVARSAATFFALIGVRLWNSRFELEFFKSVMLFRSKQRDRPELGVLTEHSRYLNNDGLVRSALPRPVNSFGLKCVE